MEHFIWRNVSSHRKNGDGFMNGIIYLVGLIVVIGVILSFLAIEVSQGAKGTSTALKGHVALKLYGPNC
jgi:hypothetical protein